MPKNGVKSHEMRRRDSRAGGFRLTDRWRDRFAGAGIDNDNTPIADHGITAFHLMLCGSTSTTYSTSFDRGKSSRTFRQSSRTGSIVFALI